MEPTTSPIGKTRAARLHVVAPAKAGAQCLAHVLDPGFRRDDVKSLKRFRKTDAAPGFTLVELVFVILIFSTLVGLSAPIFSRSLQARARQGAADDILALMSLARERSILEQRSYGVRFDFSRESYGLARPDAASSESRWRRLPAGLEFRGSDIAVFFRPDGTATPFLLDLVFGSARLCTVRVDPLFGQGWIDAAG